VAAPERPEVYNVSNPRRAFHPRHEKETRTCT
jgi:hypothetical protein